MKLENYRRINIEDYTQSEQDLIQKLASTLNVALDLLYVALDNRLNFTDNIDSTVATFSITVDANGKPTTATAFNLNVVNNVVPKALGCSVVNAVNSTSYPTGTPFISFTQSAAIITINNITGLPSGLPFSITVIVYHS